MGSCPLPRSFLIFIYVFMLKQSLAIFLLLPCALCQYNNFFWWTVMEMMGKIIAWPVALNGSSNGFFLGECTHCTSFSTPTLKLPNSHGFKWTNWTSRQNLMQHMQTRLVQSKHKFFIQILSSEKANRNCFLLFSVFPSVLTDPLSVFGLTTIQQSDQSWSVTVRSVLINLKSVPQTPFPFPDYPQPSWLQTDAVSENLTIGERECCTCEVDNAVEKSFVLEAESIDGRIDHRSGVKTSQSRAAWQGRERVHQTNGTQCIWERGGDCEGHFTASLERSIEAGALHWHHLCTFTLILPPVFTPVHSTVHCITGSYYYVFRGNNNAPASTQKYPTSIKRCLEEVLTCVDRMKWFCHNY